MLSGLVGVAGWSRTGRHEWATGHCGVLSRALQVLQRRPLPARVSATSISHNQLFPSQTKQLIVHIQHGAIRDPPQYQLFYSLAKQLIVHIQNGSIRTTSISAVSFLGETADSIYTKQSKTTTSLTAVFFLCETANRTHTKRFYTNHLNISWFLFLDSSRFLTFVINE